MSIFDQYRTSDGYAYDGAEAAEPRDLVMAIMDFCGCGRPEDACDHIRDILEHIVEIRKLSRDDYAAWSERGAQIGSDGALYFAYYVFDKQGLTEHGGSVPGWLTSKGEDVLAMLRELPKEGL